MLKQFFYTNTFNLRPNAFTITIIANYFDNKTISNVNFLIFGSFL